MNVEDAKKSTHHMGDKLKNEAKAEESYRQKFRTGKKDNSMTMEERRELAKLRKQGRAKAYKEAAEKEIARKNYLKERLGKASEVLGRTAAYHVRSEQNEDKNTGAESLDAGLSSASAASRKLQSELYSKKRYENKRKAEIREEEAIKKNGSNPQSRAKQRSLMKKEIKEQAHRASAREAANQAGNIGKTVVDKAEDLVGKLAEFLQEHPKELLVIAIVIILILLVSATFSSCGVVINGMSHVGVSSSYTAEDDEILDVNDDYKEMEEDLQDTIDNIETDYEGYDEYRYDLDNIGHNPYELAAVLTVLYEQYTEDEVQDILEDIFEYQYELTLEEEVEEKTDEDTGDTYDWYVLNVTLTNKTLDTVIREDLGLTADQLARYEVLVETYGNKEYLFADDIYSIVNPGHYGDYEVPPEALTDVRFANMIQEGEKYLGYPYVWGGSKPSTSFDCSGFVSWVINHCNNGWNVGRQTANGLLNHCTKIPVSEAKPGDLIFFKGTYDVKGASHVGIYVGEGMMLHCGSPIQYTSVNTNYWRKHFYTYGRING